MAGINSFLFFCLLVFKAWASVFLNPFFWVLVLFIFFQYRRLAHLEKSILGRGGGEGRRTASSILYGALGGLVGSLLLILAGISLTTAGINYLWLLAVLLMFLHPRFLCFSYAGGIVSVSSLLFGFPRVDVPNLMGLVAILHLVESFLIFLSGHKEAIPVSVRHPSGRTVGGFNFQKFWPIPVVALAIIPASFFPPGALFEMPDWWPLIKPALPPGADLEQFAYMLLPVIAGLGYSDLATSSFPEAKSRRAARDLAFYSLSLLGVAVLASHFSFLRIFVALLGPLGHEYVIRLGQKSEREEPPVFVAPGTGVMVLEVLPGSAAAKLGISRGSILLAVNKRRLFSSRDLEEALLAPGEYLEVEYLDRGKFYRRAFGPRVTSLGVVVVPEENDLPYFEYKEKDLFTLLGELLRGSWRR